MAKWLGRTVRVFLALFALLGLLAGAAAFVLYQVIDEGLPDLERLEDYRPFLSSRVYDRHGRAIGEFYEERRRLTPVDALPHHVVNAFVAGEDDTFFEHRGLDYLSILRAAWVNARAGGRIRQGGSTITQQVAKSLLTSERSYVRKLKDMVLARRIEQRFTKEEILFLYLNQIYLGHGAYGVGEAAHSYFAKSVQDLSVSEAALLAGLPKAPSDYSPFANPAAAEERRLYVLTRMLSEGYIDAATHAAAVAEQPRLVRPAELDDFAVAAYFSEEVRRYLYQALGRERVLRGGLRIETTLDLELQRRALEAVRHGLEELERRHRRWPGPERRVAEADIPHTLDELAGENRLRFAPSSELQALPVDRPLRGVVLSVDAATDSARIGFAAEREAVLALEDAAWALPKRSGGDTSPRGISTLLRVGDVARFQVKPAPAANASAGPEAPQTGPLRALLHLEPRVEGALVCLDAAAGDVLALIGGYDFARSEFDRATQARRQPGSAFKPFVYGAALQRGYTPLSIVLDAPVVLIDPGSRELWRPENYTKKFLGPLTLRESLARSVNNSTVRLLMDVGVDRVIAYARSIGIRSPLGRNLSLALGSTELSLLELTRAYATFASGGHLVSPRFIASVRDREGRLLLEGVSLDALEERSDAPAQPSPSRRQSVSAGAGLEAQPPQVLQPSEAFLMTHLLRAVIEEPYGTGRKAHALGHPLAGKTGTTNDQKDAWFIGYSPDLVAGVWVGHDSKEVLGKKETGGRAALPIWMEFMQSALANTSPRDFPVPEGIVFARVGGTSSELGGAPAFLPFQEGTEPGETPRTEPSSDDSYELLRMEAF